MCGSATLLALTARDVWQCHSSRVNRMGCVAVPRFSRRVDPVHTAHAGLLQQRGQLSMSEDGHLVGRARKRRVQRERDDDARAAYPDRTCPSHRARPRGRTPRPLASGKSSRTAPVAGSSSSECSTLTRSSRWLDNHFMASQLLTTIAVSPSASSASSTTARTACRYSPVPANASMRGWMPGRCTEEVLMRSSSSSRPANSAVISGRRAVARHEAALVHLATQLREHAPDIVERGRARR